MLNLDTHILIHALSGDLTPGERKLLSGDELECRGHRSLGNGQALAAGTHRARSGRSRFTIALSRIRIWPLELEIARTSTQLDFQGDPADELIAATSVVHRVPWSLATGRFFARRSYLFRADQPEHPRSGALEQESCRRPGVLAADDLAPATTRAGVARGQSEAETESLVLPRVAGALLAERLAHGGEELRRHADAGVCTSIATASGRALSSTVIRPWRRACVLGQPSSGIGSPVAVTRAPRRAPAPARSPPPPGPPPARATAPPDAPLPG